MVYLTEGNDFLQELIFTTFQGLLALFICAYISRVKGMGELQPGEIILIFPALFKNIKKNKEQKILAAFNSNGWTILI